MNGLNNSSAKNLLNASASSSYESFFDTLKLLSSTGERRVLRMWEEELRENYEEAKRISKLNGVNAVAQSKLKLILGRSIEQWVIFANNKNTHLANTF